MINRQLSLLALSLGAASTAAAQTHKVGSFEDGGDTLVSAMMVRSPSSSTPAHASHAMVGVRRCPVL